MAEPKRIIKRHLNRAQERALGRQLFWSAVREVTPEVVDELFASVGPLYKPFPAIAFSVDLPSVPLSSPRDTEARADSDEEFELLPTKENLAGDCADGFRWILDHHDLLKASRLNEGAQALLKSLRSWAQQFNFQDRDTWILDAGLYSLRRWTEDPRHNTIAVLTSGSLAWPHEFRCTVEDDWYSDAEPRKEFEDRVRAAVDEQLAAFFEKVEAAGYPQVQLRDPDAFKWLALFQVKKISPNEIMNGTPATRERVSKDSVLNAVKARATMIGLTLRPSVRGPKARKKV